ncbi:MAG: peroxiredoxin-like family protein [Anaerolineae bacterium]
MTLNTQLIQVSKTINLPTNTDFELGRILTRLEDAGTAPGLYLGQRAPDFTLPDAVGRPVSLQQRLDKGPVVISFNRGAWCPYCNTELRALQDILPQILSLGASLISVSPQKPDDSLSLTQRYLLEFDLLSDTTQKISRDFKLWYEFPTELRMFYSNIYGIDVSKENANGEWTLPVPGTFILDRSGVVRARHVAMDYRQRMEPAEILTTLRRLRSAA